MVFDLGADVVAEVVHAVAGIRVFGDAFEHVVDELAEQMLVLSREAEHPPDDVDGDVLRVGDSGVDHGLAGRDVGEPVEQLSTEAAHLWLPRLDLLRGERREQQSTRHPMERRIARDRRRPADRSGHREVAGATDRHHHRATGEVVGVVGDGVDGVVRQRHPHAAIAIGVSDGATALAQLLPDLRRDGVVRGVAVIEVGREVLDRPVVGGVIRHAQPHVCALGSVTDDRHILLAAARGRGGRDFGRIDVLGHVCATP